MCRLQHKMTKRMERQGNRIVPIKETNLQKPTFNTWKYVNYLTEKWLKKMMHKQNGNINKDKENVKK